MAAPSSFPLVAATSLDHALRGGDSLIGVDLEQLQSGTEWQTRHSASLEEKWRKLATLDGLNPFHWQLEFPEVFLAEGRSGFDGFVGNPPLMETSASMAATDLNFLRTVGI